MRAEFHPRGYALMAAVVFLLLVSLGANQLRHNSVWQQRLLTEQQAREARSLEQIRSSLLGFAASQGFHSQSHLGHLPCPSALPDQPPQTACLNKPWGYLPVQSKIAVNYLNAGIDPQHNEQEPSLNKTWHYAVSSQLIQPNLLNWSRWVDYSKPPIQVRIPEEDDRIENNVAAVVAREILSIGPNQYEITPPYMMLYVPELQQHMTAFQQYQLRDTLRAWQQQNPAYSTQLLHHENFTPLPGSPNTYQPVDSGCTCSCTKTRCNCSCNGTGEWLSESTCWGAASNCTNLPDRAICTSTPGLPCLFSGPAKLASLWPVSRFEPVAAANKSCRPNSRNECPLSPDSNPCSCDFSWPENTKANLNDLDFTLQNPT